MLFVACNTCCSSSVDFTNFDFDSRQAIRQAKQTLYYPQSLRNNSIAHCPLLSFKMFKLWTRGLWCHCLLPGHPALWAQQAAIYSALKASLGQHWQNGNNGQVWQCHTWPGTAPSLAPSAINGIRLAFVFLMLTEINDLSSTSGNMCFRFCMSPVNRVIVPTCVFKQLSILLSKGSWLLF